MAVPLLGSGCGAFPKDVASDGRGFGGRIVAALRTTRRRRAGTADEDGDGCEGSVVVFGLLERDGAEDLSAKLKRLLSD